MPGAEADKQVEVWGATMGKAERQVVLGRIGEVMSAAICNPMVVQRVISRNDCTVTGPRQPLIAG